MYQGDAGLDLAAPLPPEVRHVVAALKGATPEQTAVRVERILSTARGPGRLASFDALYFFWLATDFHHKPHGDYAAAAAALETAVARALPPAGAEEATLERRMLARVREGRFAEAADLDPRLDLTTVPRFWDLPRAAHDCAVAALEQVGRSREASRLLAIVNRRFRPKLVHQRPRQIKPSS